MLLTEWKTEDAIKVWYEECREEGWAEAWGKSRIQIAQTALHERLPLEVIQKITGLDMDAIREIQAGF